MRRALVFGSLNIDYVYEVPHFVAAGETLAAGALNLYPGGKGLNQSIALSRAGMETWMAGAVGGAGRFLITELNGAGVNTERVAVLAEGRSGHAIIQRTESGENCILTYGGANMRIDEVLAERALTGFGPEDLLVVQNEISSLPFIVAKAKAQGMQVALNPSPLSESLVPLLPQVDFLILNEVEAAQLVGAALDADPAYLLRKVRSACPQASVVLTLGEKGCLYSCGEENLGQASLPVQPVDTTAAGDTFTGYFLAGIGEGKDAAWALRYAATAAGIAVTLPGAAPSIPERAAVLARMGMDNAGAAPEEA